MKNEKISCRDPESALKKLLDSGKSQDRGLIYLYCLTNQIPKLSRLEIEMKAGSRPLLGGMAGKEAEDLVDTSPSLSVNPERSRGIDNAYFFYYQGLYAVVSNVSTDEFSGGNLKKNLADLEWIKEKANVHEKVIETVMNPALSASKRRCEVRKGGVKNSGVIPFKFGTIFNTEENLKIMLKEQIRGFKDALKYLEGKEEWGVKIYCALAELKENLIHEDKELLSLSNEIDSASPGKAYILKKKKEDLVKKVVNKKLNEYGQYSFERLKQRAIGFQINKLLPQEVTERKDDMILNSAFLIYKDKVSDFIDILNALKELFENKGLVFDCTGPWPPYNFCLQEEVKNG